VAHPLWLYRNLSSRWRIGYRSMILLVIVVGAHIPLLALIGFFMYRNALGLNATIATLLVAVIATLVGVGGMGWALTQLLKPVMMTSESLREYTLNRTLPELPLEFEDEVGTLMCDTSYALTHLNGALGELAHYDRLTGLPNRATFLRRLAEGDASASYALCVLRVANLPKLTLAFGNAPANTATVAFFARLEAGLADNGCERPLLSRIDAELFGFRIEAGAQDAALGDRAARLVRGLRQEITVGELRFNPEFELGLALHPVDSTEPDELLDRAIAALAPVAAEGMGVPNPPASREASERSRTRVRIEQDLRRALDRDEFVLHYQPLVDVGKQRVFGAEALIRWNHPELGLLGPGQFIGVAEESGLMDPIGQWVLEAAARQLNAWTGTDLEALRLSINLSARQFRNERIVRHISNALRSNGVSPSRLEIELTETAAMRDSRMTHAILSSLRNLGVTSAIDDFGTGYSSMSYLRTLPFDKLKIDREFVMNVEQRPKSLAICRALIELSDGLGITVLAEGTETAAEVAQMMQLGCNQFQGYYFSKPVPAAMLSDVAASLRLQSVIESSAQAAGLEPRSTPARRLVLV
jgi:EAL domain-containing protein (putative c-di-GMP-specific phosphodiesterase class I)/GGDEF domain-containing protein